MTNFRAPEPPDAAALVAMTDALCLHQGDPTGNFTIEKALRDVIAPGAPLSCLVAEEEGALEAFVFWHFAYETCYAARGGHVTDFYVSENRRGSGIAEGLLCAAARSVKAAGGEYLWLTNHKTNARARAFYAKHMEAADHVIVQFAAWERFAALAR